ncbi:MAG: ABC transporter permease [Chloroflexota bacterium]|nr:ABC transporter permease [Chloroflexota bacterium]
MLRNIWLKTLRDQRRPLLWYGIGLIALCADLFAVYPTIRDNPDLNRSLQNLPDGVKALIGVTQLDLVSPAGYLQTEFFALIIPLLFLIYAILLGANAIAGEEERRTLDLLLSYPVARGRVVREKFLALCLLLCTLGIILWLVLLVGAAAANMRIGGGQLAAATASAVLLGLWFGALALAIGCATGKRGVALGASAAVAVAGYFTQSLSSLVTGLRPIAKVSPFYYYASGEPLRQGLNLAHVIVLLAVTLVLFAIALTVFKRRDLAV